MAMPAKMANDVRTNHVSGVGGGVTIKPLVNKNKIQQLSSPQNAISSKMGFFKQVNPPLSVKNSVGSNYTSNTFEKQ
jgi:hypothetical protein